jgi:hypothetical protein
VHHRDAQGNGIPYASLRYKLRKWILEKIPEYFPSHDYEEESDGQDIDALLSATMLLARPTLPIACFGHLDHGQFSFCTQETQCFGVELLTCRWGQFALHAMEGPATGQAHSADAVTGPAHSAAEGGFSDHSASDSGRGGLAWEPLDWPCLSWAGVGFRDEDFPPEGGTAQATPPVAGSYAWGGGAPMVAAGDGGGRAGVGAVVRGFGSGAGEDLAGAPA